MANTNSTSESIMLHIYKPECCYVINKSDTLHHLVIRNMYTPMKCEESDSIIIRHRRNQC